MEVEMRRMLSLVGVLAVLFVGTQASAACVPQRSDSKADLSSFVGSWRGKFQGKKLIKLDLEIKDGKLTGNVSHAATIDVGDDGNLTNIADDLVDEPVRDAKMEGDSLHLWIGDSDDDVTEFLMTLTENNRAEVQLTNLPDGQTAPKPWEVHKAPPRDSQ